MSDNVIEIRFGEEIFGSSPRSSQFMNELRARMEMCEWKRRNRIARPTDDPATWDWNELESLDRAFELVGLP